MSSLLQMTKVYLANDHAGFALKSVLIERLRAFGYETEDLGSHSFEAGDDYPDFITPCAKKVAADGAKPGGAQSFGVIIGGSGQGEAMCANRVPGARAALFYGPVRASYALDINGAPSEDGYDIVRIARRHNDANVLSLASRFVKEEEAEEAVRVFLETPFSGDPRHVRRIGKF